MEDADRRVIDLIKKLVHRLVSTPNFNTQNPNAPSYTEQEYNQALKYSFQILSSRMTPSIAADDSAMAESIKRRLATTGKSSEALPFSDLYSKFSLKTGPKSVKNKWDVLYLLKTISDDRKVGKKQLHSEISSRFLESALAGGLPTLFESDELSGSSGVFGKLSKNLNAGGFNCGFDDFRGSSENIRNLRNVGNLEKLETNRGNRSLGAELDSFSSLNENMNKLKGLGDKFRGLRARVHVEKQYNGGILMVSKDSENIRDMAYREFVYVVKEENEVSEVLLVRDVLYACQGIDGKYVKFNEKAAGYILPELIKVPRATRIMG